MVEESGMVHARTKPANAVRHYGVLHGRVVDGFESREGASPHYEIWLDGRQNYRIAVNVRSVDGSDVLAYFDPAFAAAQPLDLASVLSRRGGFTPLRTGAAGTGGLDYLRDNLFQLASMTPIPPDASGVSLKNLLDANIERAKADESAAVIAFGEYFEDAGPDKYFGFTPEKGIHDIHMMQGNSGTFASDNRVHGDGALFLCFNDLQEVGALFIRFQTQSTDTDDASGNPK